MSVLALPRNVFRTSRKVVGHLKLPALAGAAALVYRAVRRSTPEPVARLIPDVGAAAAPAKTPARATRTNFAPTAPAEPELVVDPVPLPEPAVDLDVEVTLPSELPIRSYDALAAADAERAIRELDDAAEVRAVLQFEQENAKRAEVVTAARERLADLGQPAPR